jgi:hypothetical protein
MNCTGKIRPDSAKNQRLLEATEMKVLSKIAGRTLLGMVRRRDIRRMSKEEEINTWVKRRKS